MRKKTVIIFASLFAFLMAIGIGHHQVVCFGVKTYLRGHLPKGEKVTFDYESMRWEEGKLALQRVVVKQKGRAPLEMGIDELKIAFDLELFPFKWSQKIEVDRPLIILEKGVFEQSTKKKSLYQALDKALFRSSIQIKEGELLIGNIPKQVQNLEFCQNGRSRCNPLEAAPIQVDRCDAEGVKGGDAHEGKNQVLNLFGYQRAVFSFSSLDKEGGGQLVITKKGEEQGALVRFKKEGQLLALDLEFLQCDAMWAFSIGRMFLPAIDEAFNVAEGVLAGPLSLTLAPSDQVENVRYDLKLSDFACIHKTYGANVKVQTFRWKEHFHSREEIDGSKSHPFFDKVWPYFVGDGEVLGLHVAVDGSDVNEEWTVCDVNGAIRFSRLNAPLIEFHGMYGEGDKETPFHLIGEGKVAKEGEWTLALDAHLFSSEEVRGYLAVTSQGDKRFLVEGEWQNFTPHQVNLVKHFAMKSHPKLSEVAFEEGLYHGKGMGWIDGGVLSRLEIPQLSVDRMSIRLPGHNVLCVGDRVQGKGEFDFLAADFFDGTWWELQVENGEAHFGERRAYHLALSLAMHDQYIKPSTLEGSYSGSHAKVAFEGLYTHLNLSIDALVSSETLAEVFQTKQYHGLSDPLMVDLDMKLETTRQQMGVTGTLAFIRDHGKDDGIEFGWNWDLAKVKEGEFKKGLELGWFKGEHLSDRTLNLPLLFFNKSFRGKGEIGIEGTFNQNAVEFTVDPTRISYLSKEISIEPQFKEGEKAPTCTFYYDFSGKGWRGKIPLKEVRVKEHTFGITFDTFTSEVDLEGTEFVFQNVDAKADDIHFDAEILLDFSQEKYSDLKIHTYAIHGKASDALCFLRHFEMFQGAHFPLQGTISSGPGEMRLHAKVGEEQELLEWKVALNVKEGHYPFSPTLAFQDLEGSLYYSADEKRVVVEKVAGMLSLTAGEIPRFFDLNVPLLEVDAQEGILVYDCRLEAPTYEICRFVGTGKQVDGVFSLLLDKEQTRLYGAQIDVKEASFTEGNVKRLDIETTLSALDLVHHLDFLSASGLLPIHADTLDEMRGPTVKGEIALSFFHDAAGEKTLFKAKSGGLSLGQVEIDHLSILGRKEKETFKFEQFEIGALSASAEMMQRDNRWEIPSFQLVWKESYLKGKRAYFDGETKELILPIEGLRLNLGEISPTFPQSVVDWNYLKGIFFSTGKVVVDFSSGWQHPSFDSHLTLVGEDFGKGKLRLESAETLSIFYHPSSGLQIGNAQIHFLHPRSNQLWAKCAFDALQYCDEQFTAQGVKLVVPPEMVTFLGQTKSLPHIAYEEERLIVFGYPVRWDNQLEGAFDLSFGKKIGAKGSLKEGYYWIGDRAWHFNRFCFDVEGKNLKLNVDTAIADVPFECAAHLKFDDRFCSRIEIKEQTKEGQKDLPFVLVTDWNDQAGFFIQSIEGCLCGLDFAFHRNPKDSFLDRIALAGQLKINGYRLARFLPESAKAMMEEFEIGRGYELSGNLLLSKTNFEESQFSGYLKGKNFHLMGSVMETLMSEILIHPKAIELSRFNLSDVSGIFSVETIRLTENSDEGWELFIPELAISDFRPSLLKKIGQYPSRIKPLVIRSLYCHSIRGNLGDAKSFTGKGDLSFINTFKRDYHILDIPLEILGRLGLDMGLLVPVRGELDFVMSGGRIYLTELKGSYSEGKRSQFFLSPIDRSYLDFDGNLNINIKMKQYVLLKVTEPFTLSIGGTFAHPKYGLR